MAANEPMRPIPSGMPSWPASVPTAINAPSITRSPCAKLTTETAFQIRVYPSATSAYTAPIASPEITIWSRTESMGLFADDAVEADLAASDLRDQPGMDHVAVFGPGVGRHHAVEAARL